MMACRQEDYTRILQLYCRHRVELHQSSASPAALLHLEIRGMNNPDDDVMMMTSERVLEAAFSWGWKFHPLFPLQFPLLYR